MSLFQIQLKKLTSFMMVVTMQAISGAGYPGVSSMDIIDNIVTATLPIL